MKIENLFAEQKAAVTNDWGTMDTLIKLWKVIYRGNPLWLEYEYATLKGSTRKRIRKSMRPGKLVCHELASLIWSEFPEITADQDIMRILKESGFWTRSQQFSERVMALGGGALKLYVKDGRILMDYIPADRFVPVSWDNNGVYEADFIDRRVVEGKTYARIESHRLVGGKLSIKNEAYLVEAGTAKKVSLSKMGLDKIKDIDTVSTEKPIFAYISNPEDNNLIPESPLGISLFANAVDTIESLDIAFDALQSEIVLGRKRIIVPASSVRVVVDSETGQPHRYFDPADEVFQAFSTDDIKDLKISDNSVELRVADIRMAIQTLLDILSVQIGFSPGHLSFDGVSMKTATEVISENSKTFKTKQTWEGAFGKAVLQIMESARALAELYEGYTTTNAEYSIHWNDSVIEDRNSKAKYWLDRYAAKTVQLHRVIMELDGLPEKEARERAAEILSENASVDASDLWGDIE